MYDRILVTWYRICCTCTRIHVRILRTVQNFCTIDRILYPVKCRTVKSTEFWWISVVQNSCAHPEFWTLSRVLHLHTEFMYAFWATVQFHWTCDTILDTLLTTSVQLTKILEVGLQKSIPKFCIRVMSDDAADNSGKFK